MTSTNSQKETTTPAEDNYSFGKKLRVLREKAGLTQPELAFLVGVHETTIRRWEAGNKGIPRIEEVRKLAEALHVTEQELLSNNASALHEKGWVLTVRIAHEFKEEVLDVGKCIPRKATIITTSEGGYLCLGGDYSLWNDNDNFKKFIADLKKYRATVIQNGIALGGIKA